MAVSGIGNAYGICKQDGRNGKCGNEEYLKSLQKKVPYVKLETGFALNMKKDKRAGVITVNPELLKKMQNDPEAAKKYTQTLKDIERAEKTGDAYYNGLGGVVERTSHWYVDEEGNFSHFAYTRRDDRLNKKIRREAQEKSEELIEKNREKAVEARKKRKEALTEKLEGKKVNGKEKEIVREIKGAKSLYGENIVVEFSKDGMEALAQKKETAASEF